MKLKTPERRANPARARNDRRRAARYQDRRAWCTLIGTGLDLTMQVADTSAVGYRLSCTPSSSQYGKVQEILADAAKHIGTTCMAQVKLPAAKTAAIEKVRIVKVFEKLKEIIVCVERGVA